MRTTRKSIAPPSLKSWDDLWSAFDNRAKYICVFRPDMAVHTITDRRHITGLQKANAPYDTVLQWIDKAMATSGSPHGKIGEPDATVLLKIMSSTSHASPSPRDRRRPGKKGARREAIEALMTKHNQHMKDNDYCFNFNRGVCKEKKSHTDRNNKRQHSCGVCDADHALVNCPSVSLPP
jgi:hypothetical protein